MRLYYAPGTISVAVAIALHEAGLPFEARKVDFRSGEQTRPDYLAINPKGRVPVLETKGLHLTETGALLDYIAACAPQARLLPENPEDAAHMRGVMYYLAGTMHVNHAHKSRGARWADRPESLADMTEKVPQTMAQSADFVEQHCLRGDYVLGATFSLADSYLFVVCSWLDGDGVQTGRFPKIAAFQARMRQRSSVQTVIAQGMLTT